MVGWLAPLLLVILRIAQGFALGGEWSGAALVATENAPAGKRAWYGTFPQLGAPIGFIIANGLFLVIDGVLPIRRPVDALAGVPRLGLAHPVPVLGRDGHRRPLGAAAPRRVDGLRRRRRRQGKLAKLPLASVFRNYWKQLILGTFFMLATYVLFYLMTTFSLGLRPFPGRAGRGRAARARLLVQHVRAHAHRRRRVLRHLHPRSPAPGPTAGAGAARSSG